MGWQYASPYASHMLQEWSNMLRKGKQYASGGGIWSEGRPAWLQAWRLCCLDALSSLASPLLSESRAEPPSPLARWLIGWLAGPLAGWLADWLG